MSDPEFPNLHELIAAIRTWSDDQVEHQLVGTKVLVRDEPPGLMRDTLVAWFGSSNPSSTIASTGAVSHDEGNN
jgi:hypothetical protein